MSFTKRAFVGMVVGAVALSFVGCVTVEPAQTVYTAPDGFSTDAVVWYGLDFSKAKFVGKSGFPDPKDLKTNLMVAWNDLILTESAKYDISTYFGVGKVEPDLAVVAKRNEEPDPETMVLYASDPAPALGIDAIKEIIKGYEVKQTEGVGLVFIVESLDKPKQTAYVHIVHFDIATKEVLSLVKGTGKASGMGLRNYWANSFRRVMESYQAMQEELSNS